MICPKCQFEQSDSKYCANCGVIFEKYQATLDRAEQNKNDIPKKPKIVSSEKKYLAEKLHAIIPSLNQPWKPVTTPALFFITLMVSLHIIFFPKTTRIEGWSFFFEMIHNVNLAFHEAGHILFGIIGNDTLMILGGSLNQILIPLIVFLSFFHQRDQTGTAFALIWFFGNFIDVSIYMADGRFLKLPLIGGLDLEAHDWRNLFNRFDLWGVDQALSKIMFYSGWSGILLTELWLYKNWKNRVK
jgi:hypothetical protein